MMDTCVPGEVIRITIPFSLTVVPIEKRKGSYNREDTIDRLEERLAAAGWGSKRVPKGPLSVHIRAASLPPPAGLSKRAAAALMAGNDCTTFGPLKIERGALIYRMD